MLYGVAGIVWDNGVSGGRFSVYAVRWVVLVSGDGYVQKMDLIVEFSLMVNFSFGDMSINF
jgi:hypothetical protein